GSFQEVNSRIDPPWSILTLFCKPLYSPNVIHTHATKPLGVVLPGQHHTCGAGLLLVKQVEVTQVRLTIGVAIEQQNRRGGYLIECRAQGSGSTKRLWLDRVM